MSKAVYESVSLTLIYTTVMSKKRILRLFFKDIFVVNLSIEESRNLSRFTSDKIQYIPRRTYFSRLCSTFRSELQDPV